MSPSWPAALPAGAVLMYLMLPAAASAPFGAWPLTPAGAGVFVVALGAAILAARLKDGVAAPYRWTMVLVVLMLARVILSGMAADAGWVARYYANDSWSGRPEWSSDFRMAEATRIDRELSFEDGNFPLHFLNGAAFPSGNEREVTESLSMEWQGMFSLPSSSAVAARVTARGEARLLIDGIEWTSTTDAVSIERTLDAGPHTAVVRYRKPAGLSGGLAVRLQHPSTNDAIAIFQPGSGMRTTPVVDMLATVADVSTLLTLLAMVMRLLTTAWRSDQRTPVVVSTLVVGGLGLQGLLTALPSAERFRSLSSGDDWLGFESRARDILQHGPLMTLGHRLGEGEPYFYHPFYSYWLAGVHAVFGESLFGPIFVNFLLLAATALIMWRFVRGFFGAVPAAYALLALIALFELDFVRYYTVTLLSENLYVLVVTLCLVWFAEWGRTAKTIALVQAGVWAGISSATRPAMMIFFGPALLVTSAMAFRQRRGRWPILAPAILATAWLGTVFPFTLRNWVVAKKLVLISDGLGGATVLLNVPRGIDSQIYLAAYRGGITNSLAVLWRIAVEHPAGVLSLQVEKLGFTLGMVHWFKPYRPHPELVAITLLYFAMLLLWRPLRRSELWPLHAFVVSHWASMALTSPWNYGYRMILPPYIYTCTLAVASASALVMNARSVRPQ